MMGCGTRGRPMCLLCVDGEVWGRLTRENQVGVMPSRTTKAMLKNFAFILGGKECQDHISVFKNSSCEKGLDRPDWVQENQLGDYWKCHFNELSDIKMVPLFYHLCALYLGFAWWELVFSLPCKGPLVYLEVSEGEGFRRPPS